MLGIHFLTCVQISETLFPQSERQDHNFCTGLFEVLDLQKWVH
jgi:hypothetical protein